MIKACKLVVRGYPITAVYVNGSVTWRDYDARGAIRTYGCKYDRKIHTLVDSSLDYQMIAFRVFYQHLASKHIIRFAKSVLWKEDTCIRIMFNNLATYNRAIAVMRCYNILTVDGKYLCLGEIP